MSGPEHFDAVVVGSGFGGAVMAHRLASELDRVCVLERGQAYPPGSFARTPYAMRRNFWDPRAGLHGLFNIWNFGRMSAVVSSGLGGGSLIYANVLLRKDPAWFAEEAGRESWPLGYAELEPHYENVEAVLKPATYPFVETTPKSRAFRDAARARGLDWMLPPLGITFAPGAGAEPIPGEPIAEEPNLHGRTRLTCQLTGECDLGCNVGAKNTLDFNYLSMAQRAGAELRTLCEVRAFAPAPEGYRVEYLEHTAGGTRPVRRTVTATRLILAAGTLGTNHLLLRNRGAFPRLSPRLGEGFSGNGDLLTFAVPRKGSAIIDPSYGPVITSAIRHPDELDGGAGVGRGFYLEDAGFPAFATWLLQVFDTPGVVWRWRATAWGLMKGWLRGKPDTDMGAELSRLFDRTDLSAGVLPLLGMGRDVPDGRLSLRGDTLDLDWDITASAPFFERVREMARAIARELGADLVDNPVWHLGRHLITVHPLGGCRMSTSPAGGVVDPHGEVHGYPGLFVADGSVMPGPVGANPSLTIAALADRFADRAVRPPT